MVSPIAAALVASTLLPSALAFVNTAPFVLWSQPSLPAVAALSSQIELDGAIVDSPLAYDVLKDESLCSLGGVLVLDQEGLHASDLASMSFLSRLLPSATLELQYLTSTSPSLLDESLSQLAKSCGSVVQALQAGEHIVEGKTSVVQIVKVDGQAVVEEKERDASIKWEDALISPQITTFLTTHASSHLIVLTGHPSAPSPPSPIQIQQRNQPKEVPLLAVVAAAAPSTKSKSKATSTSSSLPKNGTKAGEENDLPLLARYQILSTPIITCLIVSFGLLLPILAFGISALQSIKVPERMTATKGIIVTGEKKNQ